MNRNLQLLLFYSSLVSISVGFASADGKTDEVIYIVIPSESTSCPAEPCYTLSQFAENLRQPNFLSFNTTLIILPGNHTTGSIISITNVANFSLFALSSISPNIVCQQNASFNFDNIDNILLKGLIFIGCGGNRIISVGHLTVDSCLFIGQRESKTALEIIKSSASIVNASLLFNEVGSYRGPFGILLQQDSNNTISPYTFVGGAMIVNQSNLSITGCRFERNHAILGGAIFGTGNTSISITNSNFTDNYACVDRDGICCGGAIYIENPDHSFEAKANEIVISDSMFFNNTGFHGGVLAAYNCSVVKITSSKFNNNTTGRNFSSSGGALDLTNCTVAVVTLSLFIDNFARTTGGSVNVESSNLTISDSKFENSLCTQFGGVIGMSQGTLTIYRSSFNKNGAFQGGVLNVYRLCFITIYDSTFTGNIAVSDAVPQKAGGGVIIILEDTILNIHHSHFYNNTATAGGVLSISSRTELKITSSSFVGNRAKEAGVLTTYHSNVYFYGRSNMSDNSAVTGGAVAASGDSILNVYDDLSVIDNRANSSGGGIYLYRSKLNCQQNGTLNLVWNQATEKGGGICAINSIVNVYSDRDSLNASSIRFVGNMAEKGGGIYLEMTAELFIIKSGNDYTRIIYNLHFVSNLAKRGAAMYVADETNIETCAVEGVGEECFLQIITIAETIDMKYNVTSIAFENNTANVSGPVLYGGLLDRCILSPSAEILLTRPFNDTAPIDGVTFLLNTSGLLNADGISSSPVQVCFCQLDSVGVHPNCSIEHFNVSNSKKGERFTVPLVAVDQVGRIAANTTIFVSLKYGDSGLGEGDMVQMTGDTCTDLNFRVFSLHSDEEITLYADGPCRSAARSEKKVFVSFQKCSCPIGFEPNDYKKDSCVCVCDSKLHNYISNCSAQTGTVTRRGDAWISYLNKTGYSENDYSYLMIKHCPLDYCQPEKSIVQINLSEAGGADVQCVNGRSGILCGVCRPGLSLSLGRSKCISCNKDRWALQFIEVAVGALVAGVLLVTVMLVLNLTVAEGTLNGLIFYANIIGVNSSLFFPSSVRHFNVYFIFISWLNLDFGMEFCLFPGMDTYWKTWIQLAFPTYVILLVVMVIMLSKHSIKFTELISKKNPVATLATLILLSYATFLRTVITATSNVRMSYPDGHRRLWLPDARIKFLTGKHTVLFTLAILILIVGIIYTVLLFSWQWLWKIRWVNKHHAALNHFIEAYHAPYEVKHRYWTGLLLLLRGFLYLVFAVGTPSINLLTNITVACSLLFFKAHFGRIYKSRFVDVIEMISYLNIALFSAAKAFSLETEKYQTLVVILSVYVTVALFIIVVSYHIHVEVSMKLWARFGPKRNRQSDSMLAENGSGDHVGPTFSIIDGIPQNGLPTSTGRDTERTDSELTQVSANSSSALSESWRRDEEDVSNSSTPLLDKVHLTPSGTRSQTGRSSLKYT